MKLADFLEYSCQSSEIILLNCAIVIKCNRVYLFDYILSFKNIPSDKYLFCIDDYIDVKSIQNQVPLLGGGEISYIGSCIIKVKKDSRDFGKILTLTTFCNAKRRDIFIGESIEKPDFMMKLIDLRDGFTFLAGILYMEDGVCYLTDKNSNKKIPIKIDNIQDIVEQNCRPTEEWPVYKLYVSIVAKFSSSKDYIEDIKSWSFYYDDTCIESFNGIGIF